MMNFRIPETVFYNCIVECNPGLGVVGSNCLKKRMLRQSSNANLLYLRFQQKYEGALDFSRSFVRASYI